MRPHSAPATPLIWTVSALCRAVGDALDARFNPVTVTGELSGVVRAASGHLYFSIKDDAGQLRCAMFRRSASGLGFTPADGDRVEVRGRLSVYEPRGDLQLVVETMVRAGQGTLFEQFLALKAKLEAEGLFDTARKRAIPALPSRIGLVTSVGAAALHDVSTALQRRLPHVQVILAPASVQGAGAPAEMVRALQSLYAMATTADGFDTILLVRGGGSLEDLWAFNDERLARTIAQSPVPLICGVGHETDFTIADFVADLRAPTPTAAAELAGTSHQVLSEQLAALQSACARGMQHRLQREAQRVDMLSAHLARPSTSVAGCGERLDRLAHRMAGAVANGVTVQRHGLQRLHAAMPGLVRRCVEQKGHALSRTDIRLQSVDPRQVLQRGYAWLATTDGRALTRVAQFKEGDVVRASLADGAVDMAVRGTSAD